MSDEQIGGAYQPSVEPGQASPQPEGDAPQFVTKAELETLRQQMIDEAKRAAQSLSDKQESRVQKRLSEWEKKVAESGITVDSSLRQQAMNRIALSELDAHPGSDPAAQPVAHDLPPAVKDVQQYQREEAAKYGFKDYGFEENDPEIWELNYQDPDPERFKRNYAKKLQEKAARLGVQQQPPGSPAARIGTPAGAPTGNQLDTLTRQLTELQKNPFAPGNKEKRTEIERQLKALRG